MFPWVKKFVDEVPKTWSVKLEPSQPNEKVLGKLVGEDGVAIYKAWLGAMYALEQVEQLSQAHLQDHAENGAATAMNCADVHAHVDRQLERAGALGWAAEEAMKDFFGLSGKTKIAVRQEGVVQVLPGIFDILAAELSRLGVQVRVAPPVRLGLEEEQRGYALR